VSVAALGTAVSAAVLGVSAAFGGGHSDTVTPSAGHAAPASAVQAAAPVAPVAPAVDPGTDGATGMAGMGGTSMESDGLALYAVQTGTLGVVATDGAGRLLYGSDGDANNPPTSHCTGACAQEWQPVVVPEGQKPELLGVSPDKIGRIGREDGSSQLTLGGWPVYVNRDDEGGLTAAASAHGSWFVITPQGGKIQL
jgi:predicted lipoprotein with Yx(FWY)xxD motif